MTSFPFLSSANIVKVIIPFFKFYLGSVTTIKATAPITSTSTTKHPCYKACSQIYIDIKSCLNCIQRPSVIKAMRNKHVTFASSVDWIPATFPKTTTTTTTPFVKNSLVDFCLHCTKGLYHGRTLLDCLTQCKMPGTAASLGEGSFDFRNAKTTGRTTTVSTTTTTTLTAKKNVDINSRNRRPSVELSSDVYLVDKSTAKKFFMMIVPSMTFIVLLLVVIVLLLQKKRMKNARAIRILPALR